MLGRGDCALLEDIDDPEVMEDNVVLVDEEELEEEEEEVDRDK